MLALPEPSRFGTDPKGAPFASQRPPVAVQVDKGVQRSLDPLGVVREPDRPMIQKEPNFSSSWPKCGYHNQLLTIKNKYGWNCELLPGLGIVEQRMLACSGVRPKGRAQERGPAALGFYKVTKCREQLANPRRGYGLLFVAGMVLLLYLLLAYVILPLAWRRVTRRHPNLSGGPRVTHTPNGIPGDPVNIALVGSESEVIHAMMAGGWYPADPITFRSSVRIAADWVFHRPYDYAPVSNLGRFGRKQDLAFEQPVGNNPRRRNHVRFWHWDHLQDGREVWFGAATFDEGVGLSHTTGQVTNHICPDVDAERDRILLGLEKGAQTQEVYWVPGFHTVLQGKNVAGDPWYTDGRLGVAVLLMGRITPVEAEIVRDFSPDPSKRTGIDKVGSVASGAAARLPNVFHVRLVAPLATRIRHTAEYYQLNEAEAAKFVREKDQARRRYVRRYFNAKIDDPTLYDVTLNTGRFGFARAAAAIAQMALQHHRAFAGRDQPIVTMASSGLSG